MFLIWHMGYSLLLDWRGRVDPIGTFELMVDLTGGALSKRKRAALLRGLREDLREPEPLESTAMLEAIGRWFCRLQLPKDEEELMAGGPLRLRLRR